MARKTINALFDRTNLSSVNDNFEELFKEKDSQNNAINTFNAEIQRVKQNSESFISKSNEILNKAIENNEMNQDVQSQINDLIISEGQSDAEVIQARGNHSVLNERLNTIDDEVVNVSEVAKEYDLKTNNISTRAAIAIKKMNTSPEEWLGNSIEICVWGNSLGAGNGASSESLSWPNRLKNTLNRYSRTGQVVTMINRSIGGYYASQVNDEFPEPSGADISIISFGTNEFNKVQRTELYAEALEKIIKKEVEGGSTIVLTTMPQWGSKDWQVKASNGSMEDYNQIVHDLGNKYNIAVLDLYKETRNLDWSAYKTGEEAPHIHLNDLGYQMLSEKVAAFIGFQTPGTLRQLKNNDFLGVRAGVDGIKYAGDYLYLSESENYPTPSEATQNKGTAISSGNDEKTFYYAVNIDEDNLALFPNFKFTKTDGTESLTIYINNRNNPFDYSNTFINSNSFNRSVGVNTKILRFSDFTKHANQYNTQNIYANSNMPLHNIMFPVSGHYTLTVKVKNCDFFGFDCVGGNIAKLIQSKNDTGWIPFSLTGVSNTDSNKPSAYRKIVDGDKTEIHLRIATNGTTGQVFATLPSGFHPGQLTRLPAFSGTDNSGLVIGASGNLVATTGDSHDFRCTQSIVL